MEDHLDEGHALYKPTRAEHLLLVGHLLGAVATAITTAAYALRLTELGRISTFSSTTPDPHTPAYWRDPACPNFQR